MLGNRISRKHGEAGLPDDTIQIHFTGSAGQSLGAFVPRGVTIRLHGDTNDYLGKGLPGGKPVVRPPEHGHPQFVSAANVIAVHVILYVATAGEVYIGGAWQSVC